MCLMPTVCKMCFPLKITFREFPCGPAVRTWHFHCRGPGSVSGWGTKIPQARWYSKKKFKKAFNR